MVVTLNFATIFAWIGGIVCGIVTLCAAYWCIVAVIGMGEFMGIWAAIGWKVQDIKRWLSSKFGRQQ
jgi:hypothetical protein